MTSARLFPPGHHRYMSFLTVHNTVKIPFYRVVQGTVHSADTWHSIRLYSMGQYGYLLILLLVTLKQRNTLTRMSWPLWKTRPLWSIAVLPAVVMAIAITLESLSVCTLSTDRKFTEIVPLKAAMLTKQWQGLMLDVEEKVGVVPELGSTSVATRRSGPELPRRALCKLQFAKFYESTFAMALADKNPPKIAAAKRKLIQSLVVDGKPCGPDCAAFASLTSPATMALVVQQLEEWSILALAVNPTERNLEAIVAAENAMLAELRARAQDADASIRLLDSVRKTLAGDCDQLCLVPIDNDDQDAWFQC